MNVHVKCISFDIYQIYPSYRQLIFLIDTNIKQWQHVTTLKYIHEPNILFDIHQILHVTK